jgi:site-specific recombinase XerD
LKKRFCEYLEYGRPPLDRRLEPEAFLLGLYGRRLSGQAVYEMVKRLRIRTEINPEKVNKIGVHTLRHSIATHLHHSGLSIEKVAQFLGHKTLESTQRYTHLVHELR